MKSCLFLFDLSVHNRGMTFRYVRVSADGRSVEAQVAALTAAAAGRVHPLASDADTARAQFRRVLSLARRGRRADGDQASLARSADLLTIRASIAGKGAGSRSIGDTRVDTATPHGLILAVLGSLAEFERELIRARTGEGGERVKARDVNSATSLPLETRRRLGTVPTARRTGDRDRTQLQRLG